MREDGDDDEDVPDDGEEDDRAEAGTSLERNSGTTGVHQRPFIGKPVMIDVHISRSGYFK